MDELDQIEMFSQDENINWKEHWEGMPEYNQIQILPFDEITVRFKNEKDRNDFFKLLEQKRPEKYNSIWYPKIKSNPILEVFVNVT